MSSLWAESMAHYFVLIIGYLAFSTFLKSKVTKIMFALIWFFPLLYFIGLVRYSPGLQYSILAVVLYLANNYSRFTKGKLVFKIIYLSLIILLSITSIWVSDLAIISLFIILFYIGLNFYFKKRTIIQLVFNIEFASCLFGLIIGSIIIYYFKHSVPIAGSYQYNKQLFNSFPEFLESLNIVKDSLIDVFIFKIDRKSTRLNSSHTDISRMPSSA